MVEPDTQEESGSYGVIVMGVQVGHMIEWIRESSKLKCLGVMITILEASEEISRRDVFLVFYNQRLVRPLMENWDTYLVVFYGKVEGIDSLFNSDVRVEAFRWVFYLSFIRSKDDVLLQLCIKESNLHEVFSSSWG